MTTTEYTFRIQRNHRGEDGHVESRWQDFRVALRPNATVLSGLEEIKGQQDGSLTYRMSCRSYICGSCAMRINGRTRLACKTHVGQVADAQGVVEISPMRNHAVLKDLAVDIGSFFQLVRQVDPFLQEGEESVTAVDARSYDQVNNVSQCILCGCCHSDCTMAEVSPRFLGPAALAKAFRFVSDPREGQKSRRLEQLSGADGMWSCSRCTLCVEVCPKDVAPMEAIVKLRTRGVARGLVEGHGARHALAFHTDLQEHGDLNEFTLMQRTLGIVGTLSELGAALHLARKHKIPSPFPHDVQGVEEVRRIFQILQEQPLDVETKAEIAEPE
ncbi:MAG: 2Fe-2S iron-sulfur cluster-binding protein [Magnetococcus sp. WYHC-3]